MDYREVIPFPQKLELTLALPGSKSITHRAFVCAALARGKSTIGGALKSEDTQMMIAALKKLGVRIRKLKKRIKVWGTGGRFKKGRLVLNGGDSGIATRFLTALACLRHDPTVIKTDSQMAKRPMKELVQALRLLGLIIAYKRKRGHTPFEIKGPLKNSVVKVSGERSSQYLSALLLVSPLFQKLFKIQVISKLTSKPYVDMTLKVMKAFGVRVQAKAYRRFFINPQTYRARPYHVEGDATAATYFSSLNFLHGGTLEFTNLDYRKSIQGDVNYPAMLNHLGRGVIDMKDMPDAAMTLALTAVLRGQRTELKGLHTLKIKETDRLKALETELKKIGADAKATKNSLIIKSKNSPPRRQETGNRNIIIKTYNDHRMAMCFAVAGTLRAGLVIENPDCVNKTYPDFWKDLELAYLTRLPLKHKHLVLTGMRGAGKTYLGKKIARHLKRPFIDIDREIELDQRMTIWEMVKKYGWERFRKIEQKICSKVIAKEEHASRPLVIATGGGVVLNPVNMKHLKHNAITVFIFADPAVLATRVMQGKDRPPLKKGVNPVAEITHLWQERRPLYLKYADYVWDNTSGEVIEKNLKRILAARPLNTNLG